MPIINTMIEGEIALNEKTIFAQKYKEKNQKLCSYENFGQGKNFE